MRKAQSLLPEQKSPPGVRLEKVPSGHGGGLRVYTPDGGGSGGALYWIHGGGMVIGAGAQDDAQCYETARALDVVIVSVEYRLAPEHPYPEPMDDCMDGWRWLHENAAARGIDPSRVAIGGQSAGGGLAAGLVQRIHDEGGVQPVAQWLFCPMLDDRTAARRELDSVKHILWNNVSNRVGWRAYLGVTPGSDGVASYASPSRRGDLTGLPPTWIGAGDIELFFDEDRACAEALTDAGVDCTFDVVPGGPHAFESLAAKSAVGSAYLAHARDWLRRRIAVTA